MMGDVASDLTESLDRERHRVGGAHDVDQNLRAESPSQLPSGTGFLCPDRSARSGPDSPARSAARRTCRSVLRAEQAGCTLFGQSVHASRHLPGGSGVRITTLARSTYETLVVRVDGDGVDPHEQLVRLRCALWASMTCTTSGGRSEP
jgi:hypothetical protein